MIIMAFMLLVIILIAVEIPVTIYRPTEEDTLILIVAVALLAVLIALKLTT